MESTKGGSRKGRKLASSRRRQTREPADGQDAPEAPVPESWSSQTDTELQNFFQNCGAKDRGFVTCEDLVEAKFSFLDGEEEPQMIFDWVDMEHRGRLSLEEFSSGLKNIFGSSPSAHRLRRKRPPPSQRVSVTSSFPALEEAEAKEKEAFLDLVGQLGTGHSLSEQAEIWQLWEELRQEEPGLAGNLEGFLAKMSGHLQEVWADREALEQTLRKRDSDHHREVQQLYEETEEQIRREKQRLQAQSDSRGLALGTHMQEILDAKERQVQQLAEGQRELEAQLQYLSGTQQEARSENQQLREAEQNLAGQLEEMRGQLQVTRGHLDAARGRVSWQMQDEPSIPEVNEKSAPEEAPLPRLFGDSDDWDQLLSSISNHPHRPPQLSWSPPPTPRATSGPQTPRVVRQISISKLPAVLVGQEPALDPDGAPGIPTRVPSSPKDEKGVENTGKQDRRDIRAEQPVASPRLEASPEAHFLQSLSGAWAGEPGSPGATEAEPPLHGLSPLPQASAGSSKQFQVPDPGSKSPGPEPAPAKLPMEGEALPENPSLGSEGDTPFPERVAESSQGPEPMGQVSTEGPGQGEESLAGQESHSGELREARGQMFGMDGLPANPLQSPELQPKAEEGNLGGRSHQDLGSEQAAEAHGLETGNAERPQQDAQAFPPQPVTSPVPAEEAVPTPGKMSPPKSSSTMGAGSEPTVGTLGSMQTLLTLPELEAQPRPLPMSAQMESELGAPQSGEPGAESRPEKPGTDSGETGLTSPLGDLSQPQPNPDYLFHIIFLGDSNVGKTSFLHLLHHDAFATGLTATVGVDFRVKSLLVDNKCFALQLWDTAGQERYHSLTRQLLRKADGVVLMYDVTSPESFSHVRYWLDCLQDAGADGAVKLLLGNKMDCEEERQVPTEAGRHLAQELRISFNECSAALGHNILEPMVNLARSLKMQEDFLKGSLVEVAPKQPPRKAGCCS